MKIKVELDCSSVSEQTRTKLLGDLGEYLVAWYLQSRGIEVSLTKSEAMDILARDTTGNLFNNGAYVAISVKTRQRNKDNFNDHVRIEWDKLEEKSKTWNAIPYIAYVRIAPDVGILTCFLTSLKEARIYGKGDTFNVRRAEKDQDNVLFELNFIKYKKN